MLTKVIRSSVVPRLDYFIQGSTLHLQGGISALTNFGKEEPNHGVTAAGQFGKAREDIGSTSSPAWMQTSRH